MAESVSVLAALDLPLARLDKPYEYLGDAPVGSRIVVPFGKANKPVEGIVLSRRESPGRAELKRVTAVLDAEPVLSADDIKLALWVAERFFTTVYSAVRAMLPAGLWRLSEKYQPRGVVRIARLLISAEEAAALVKTYPKSAVRKRAVVETLCQNESISADELLEFSGATKQSLAALVKAGVCEITETRTNFEVAEPAPIELSPEQETAYLGLKNAGKCALLHGVTGSGKTLVYIRLLRDIVDAGGGAIVLVPEIALTPQLISTFAAHFGAVVIHSALSVGQRYDAWNTLRRGDAKVVIGTRSAVFAPVQNLKAIIIDEEQEHTYKSENNPRYHARDVAKYRCAQQDALLVLASATPSIETAYAAKSGRYHYLELKERYNQMPLPSVVIADLREDLKNGNDSTIGRVLGGEIEENLRRGEQTVLFLNRRGYRSSVVCPECGLSRECPNCSVPMTYHAYNRRMICHYCGHSEQELEKCPECYGSLKYVGAGTQKVVADLNEIFPDIEILRMDADTTSGKDSHERLLKKFEDDKIPILVGTQMITKGLNLPNVTLAGVISADMSLYTDDFRANERTFNLIAQVVGRAGRAEKSGRAVIQAYSPQNPILRLASDQDFWGLYGAEIPIREERGYPPFGEVLLLRCFGTDQESLLAACALLRDSIPRSNDFRVLGPAPAAVFRVNNRYRYHITVVGSISPKLRRVIANLLRAFPEDRRNRGVEIYADLNPINF